jgi:hypothetical protein
MLALKGLKLVRADPVDTPTWAASVSIICDYLELVAFFSEFGLARLDAIFASFKEQEDEQNQDIGEEDRKNDVLREEIENEVIKRQDACGDGYPFLLSDDGEELFISDFNENHSLCFYLVCLLATHITGSALLQQAKDPALVNELRTRVFQIIATFAMAGLVSGSAVSIGWPRLRGDTILATLRRAEALGSGFTARATAGAYAPHAAKDGGIDVISWSIGTGRIPPDLLFYGQAASGNNWQGKPVSVHVKSFESNYLDHRPMGNVCYATLFPFCVDDDQLWMNQSAIHGTLLDRIKIPHFGLIAVRKLSEGVQFDESANLPLAIKWVNDFRASL